MTQLDLQARKLNLIQDIINTIDNEELMSRLEAAYKRLKKSASPAAKRPCTYTLEEVEERLDEAVKADKAGDYVTHEDVLKEMELW
ncbi:MULTISPECIES: hypothetical protein [Parabacteroides]|uniref:Uncharacterized protein n=1 Tax=Parabacteroides chinchillae TaxID=871327 RepID=A0A8G2BVG2_9BACT|nr:MULTISPECIES: hypothetical protein [Parabacteroides]SEF72339.1 hypothetical protein SAMN05444001_105136 [Parabacteroides chinchillae]